jgi:hypothetical protein
MAQRSGRRELLLGRVARRRTSSSIAPKVCSWRWIVMPMAVRSRLAVERSITIRSVALTSWRPVANGWVLRPKSRMTSSGVAVTRQKLE